jgi:membrane protease YdiL (CAAX protease family)
VPATRGDGFAWVLFALVGFVVGQLVGLAFIYGVAGVLGQSGRVPKLAAAAVPPEWFIGASLVGLWVGLFGGAFLGSVARGTKRLVADLGIRFRLIDLVGIAIGLGGQIVVALMYAPFIHHIHNFNAPTTKLTGASHGGGFAVIAILTVFGAPFFEEVFFRGLLFKGLTRLLAGRAPAGTGRTVAVAGAIVLDGALFGLAHGELVQLAGLATFGMALAFISYKTGRLGMNMVSHASFNAVAVVVIAFSRAGVVH